MKPYESTHPIDISLLGTYAVMPVTDTLVHPIEQAHRFEWWPFDRLAGFDRIFSAVHKNMYSNEKPDGNDDYRDVPRQYRSQAGDKPCNIDVQFTLAMASTPFHLSFYGRFGYAVMAVFGVSFSAFFGLALAQYQSLPLWALAFVSLMFVVLISIGAYSFSQLFRFTPRFVLTEYGFAYRGFISRFECRWSDIVSYRLRYAGSSPFIFLEVSFSNSPSRFRKHLSLDVSGLNPDHRQLVGLFERHVSGLMKKASPW